MRAESGSRRLERAESWRPKVASVLTNVARPRAYERVALVLFYGVADPAHRPPQGEERDGPARRKLQRPRQRHEPEVHGGPLAQELEGFVDDGGAEGDVGGVRVRRGREAQQLRAARVAPGVERVPETRDPLPAPEAAGDRLARVARGLGLPHQGLDELDLTAVPDTPHRRETGYHH